MALGDVDQTSALPFLNKTSTDFRDALVASKLLSLVEMALITLNPPTHKLELLIIPDPWFYVRVEMLEVAA